MQSIVHVALVVRDYDEAIAYYTKTLGFTLVEDTYQPEQDKRWVVVAPPESKGTSLLLARASTPEQQACVGNQTGGRVFLFLNTDDFWRDHARLVSLGVTFVREPRDEPYGTVAVFKDLYGNLWDLLQLKTGIVHSGMGENKKTIETYMAGFRANDHAQILSCLADDVEWEIPGAFHVRGKEAFEEHIEDEGFVGRPMITVTRITEGEDVVVAEGVVRTQRTDGVMLTLAFCDVFEMRGGKIRRLVSYLMQTT
jgi:catechol 2,3-dioxygenase-like lactoylglutathione lyase family enzyme